MKPKALTAKQQIVYDAIRGAVEADRRCPFNTELMVLTGHKSVSTIDSIFKALERRGLITIMRRGRARVVWVKDLQAGTAWCEPGAPESASRTASAPQSGNGFREGASHASTAKPGGSMGAAAAADRGRTSVLRKPAGKGVGRTDPEDVTAGETATEQDSAAHGRANEVLGGNRVAAAALSRGEIPAQDGASSIRGERHPQRRDSRERPALLPTIAEVAARYRTPGRVPPAKDCQWPFGEPGEAGFHFCGAPSVPGKSYCAAHCDKAYVKPKPRRERPYLRICRRPGLAA